MIETIKAIKFDCFEEEFYGIAWKGEKLPLLSVLIYVLKAHQVEDIQ
jgi:hypothetical protein